MNNSMIDELKEVLFSKFNSYIIPKEFEFTELNPIVNKYGYAIVTRDLMNVLRKRLKLSDYSSCLSLYLDGIDITNEGRDSFGVINNFYNDLPLVRSARYNIDLIDFKFGDFVSKFDLNYFCFLLYRFHFQLVDKRLVDYLKEFLQYESYDVSYYHFHIYEDCNKEAFDFFFNYFVMNNVEVK